MECDCSAPEKTFETEFESGTLRVGLFQLLNISYFLKNIVQKLFGFFNTVRNLKMSLDELAESIY